MKWLKNYERVQQIQQQIIWQPITELDPRAFIPEVLQTIIVCKRDTLCFEIELLENGTLRVHILKLLGIPSRT